MVLTLDPGVPPRRMSAAGLGAELEGGTLTGPNLFSAGGGAGAGPAAA